MIDPTQRAGLKEGDRVRTKGKGKPITGSIESFTADGKAKVRTDSGFLIPLDLSKLEKEG